MFARVTRFSIAAVSAATLGLLSLTTPATASTDVSRSMSRAAAVASGKVASKPTTLRAGDWWQPRGKMTWQIQYVGDRNTNLSVQVFNMDGADTPASTVSAMKNRGIKTICYFSAGSWEDWRSDASRFPSSVKGEPLDGWAGESWLDISRLDVLMPIMTARIQNCKNKGFDGIDPDNMDVHTQESGFDVSAADQIAYHKALANVAHSMGLAIGMKNDPDQIKALEPYMDYAVNESCEQYNECNAYLPFLRANKPVFHISYQKSRAATVCRTRPAMFSTLIKNLNLDAWRQSC